MSKSNASILPTRWPPPVTSTTVGRRQEMVIGTTGADESLNRKIVEAGDSIAVVYAPNMSVGVNLCLQLLKPPHVVTISMSRPWTRTMGHKDHAPVRDCTENGRSHRRSVKPDLGIVRLRSRRADRRAGSKHYRLRNRASRQQSVRFLRGRRRAHRDYSPRLQPDKSRQRRYPRKPLVGPAEAGLPHAGRARIQLKSL